MFRIGVSHAHFEALADPTEFAPLADEFRVLEVARLVLVADKLGKTLFLAFAKEKSTRLAAKDPVGEAVVIIGADDALSSFPAGFSGIFGTGIGRGRRTGTGSIRRTRGVFLFPHPHSQTSLDSAQLAAILGVFRVRRLALFIF